ncbi:WxL domain-containing protein [Enterococcus plantarum]|uniref:WxL domain-containing protein n=1 Tax=Enterococcus plantarum TaxID=1077675 RepID=UPI001A8C0DFF|nr:WxL domain-containing protein [Enterococcus plantarum]MBO0421310.1 WxL domain-containing protein [Enterococcus plantarum]
MKKETLICSVTLTLFMLLIQPNATFADAFQSEGEGSIGFSGKYPKATYDPEHPEQLADPGPSPTTDGALRFDFVPQLNFWTNAISDTDQSYYANAQLFKDDTGVRGNFIQLSDYREQKSGWQLQLRQETQFKNTATEKELKGAVISLDKSWANSTTSKDQVPLVSKEVIHLDSIGETYNLANAEIGKGSGSWSIIFGASIDNDQNQKDTLIPRLDEKGNPLLDPDFGNKPIFENTAVSLNVPGKTKKEPGNYQTVITWILSELP